jgi:hypothetical protein
MDKPMSDSHFRLMSFGYKFRDSLVPRRSILEEADIKPGFHILDYGCYLAVAQAVHLWLTPASR